MVKKIILFLLIIITSTILASIYGAIHNQVSYSISNEYFTKFKFEQFGIYFMGQNRPRLSSAIVGIFSTWWFGLIIGIINGTFGTFQPNLKLMWKSSFGTTIRILIITICFGIIGIIIGKLIITNLNFNWIIPDNLTDKKSFLIAGTMHDFSYFGGIVGLIYGIFYQRKIKSQYTTAVKKNG
ncbi:MAG: hypothetical protein KYX68_08955 [Flavobacterium sp.]|nr:hypothetical protein [Flavobacterium sp.]